MESVSLCPLVIQYLQPNFLLNFHEIRYGSSRSWAGMIIVHIG